MIFRLRHAPWISQHPDTLSPLILKHLPPHWGEADCSLAASTGEHTVTESARRAEGEMQGQVAKGK